MLERHIADSNVNRILSPEYFRTDPTGGPSKRTIVPPAEPSRDTLAAPSDSTFRVTIEGLAPAAATAVSVALELRSLGADLNHGPPPGTPGFLTGFQLGELSREWGGAIAHLAERAQAGADRIYRTRTKYAQTESAVATQFSAGS